jgi:hypothetical protein
MKSILRSLAPTLAIVALLTALSGCPSAPPAEDPDKVAAYEAMEKANALKTRADSLALFEVLPDDYVAATETFDSGKALYDAEDWIAAKPKFDQSAAAYEDLIARGVKKIAEEKRHEAEEFKKKAQAERAPTLSSGAWNAAEAAFVEASKVEAEDPEKAAGLYARASLLYELGYKRGYATRLKTLIDERGYSSFDEANFATAEEKYALAADATADTTEAAARASLDAADEAILRYNLVLQKAAKARADTGRQDADVAKQKSEEIKSQVAAKETYDAAVRLVEQAIAAYEAGDYETAAKLFEEALAKFEDAERIAAEKKKKAEEALQAAQDAQAATGAK